MEHILEVKNLRKEYDDFYLNDISFSLDRGYIMGFIGPNGAGKSTTIKLIMNLISKNNGEVNIFGLDNVKNEIDIKQRIGFIYDQNHFYDELTLNQTKKVISNFYSSWDDEVYRKYMKLFNLKENKKIKELSKGMQMKFSLALALSHNAELIIMDEPTSGLDPVFRSDLLDILLEIIQDENRAIFFSTHITSDLEKIADYITFINNGNLVFSKPKDEVLEDYSVIKGNKELLSKIDSHDFIAIKENRFGFEGLTDKGKKYTKMFKEKAIIERPTLDDIMLYTIRKENGDV